MLHDNRALESYSNSLCEKRKKKKIEAYKWLFRNRNLSRIDTTVFQKVWFEFSWSMEVVIETLTRSDLTVSIFTFVKTFNWCL